jgi:hypothetical protein
MPTMAGLTWSGGTMAEEIDYRKLWRMVDALRKRAEVAEIVGDLDLATFCRQHAETLSHASRKAGH